MGIRETVGRFLINQRMIRPRIRNRLLRLMGVPFKGNVVCKGAWIGGTDLDVGVNAFFNRDVWIETSAHVTIGRNVAFGQQAMVCTSTHDIGDAESRAAFPPYALPVTIGDGVWVGARATILPGTTIGAGCVIAAGSVVSRDLPPNGLYGGVPARLIRQLD
jgi:maltose O-acetyltransferase